MIKVRMATLLAALTLALLGCSDDDPEPKAEVDPTPSTSTSTSATPTPEPTQSATPRSPVQTVKGWVEARNQTLKGGASAEIYALSTSECSTCRNLVEPVTQLYAEGGSIESDGWKIDGARERPDFAENQQVIAALTFSSGRTVHPGEGPNSFPKEKHILQFQMQQTARGWLVSQVVFLP